MEPTEPQPDPTPEPPQPRPAKVRPVWTYFLVPGAIVLAAAMVSAAFFVTRGDGDSADAVDSAAPGVRVASTGAASSEPGATELLTAFMGYGASLKLDTQTFRQCLSKASTADTINAHYQQALKLGLNGTPSFFINNKLVVGAQPLSVFQEVIAVELKGGATSLDAYSPAIQQLAAAGRFAITSVAVDLAGAAFDGSRGAKVTVAEFSDFQCPFCQRFSQQTLPAIRESLGDDVALAFLHFPIVQIHPNAGNASAAAVCAGEQGKFWEMHDLLFAKQKEWESLP